MHTGTRTPGGEQAGCFLPPEGRSESPGQRTQGAAGKEQKCADVRGQDTGRHTWAGTGASLPKAGLVWTATGTGAGGGLPSWQGRFWGRYLDRVWWEAGSKVGTWGPGASRYKGGTEAKQNILQKAFRQYWTCLGTKSLRSLVSQPLQ